jgi:diguanylate cyclase (GGDEF)-like protein
METISTEIKQLKRSMTIRYVIAISLIAIFSVAAFLSMDVVVKGMDKNAYLMNVSGKQRLLSQYIALDAYRVYSAGQTGLDRAELLKIKQRLQQNLKKMAEVNKTLSSGRLTEGGTIELSSEINDIYFGQENLKFRVQQYLALVRLVIDLPEHEHKKVIILDIERFSEGLLADLDKVVLQFQKEGEARLQKIKDTKFMLLLLTLLVLGLEVLFIFRPMVAQIVSLSRLKEETLEHLERQVLLRTLHLEKMNQKLNRLAHHDALTGLRNRLNLESNIEEVIEASEKNGAEFAVLMLDIDWFKSVNDQYGHEIGDFVLRELAQILIKSVREGDHVYRAGGEEFVVLLNRISYPDAKQKAEYIRKSVAEHVFSANGIKLHKTLSGGLYHSSLLKVSNVKELLNQADKALYAAKKAGRNIIMEVKA